MFLLSDMLQSVGLALAPSDQTTSTHTHWHQHGLQCQWQGTVQGHLPPLQSRGSTTALSNCLYIVQSVWSDGGVTMFTVPPYHRHRFFVSRQVTSTHTPCRMSPKSYLLICFLNASMRAHASQLASFLLLLLTFFHH